MSASTAAPPQLPLRNCYWVVPGLLLAGEHPNGATRDKTKDRLKKLLSAGIECFVDLTKPTELLRYDTLLPFHVEYTRKAIRDHGVPSAREQMVEILDYVGSSMRAGRPIYVHCRAGIGRTGTVIGCLLVERGLSGDGALDELNRLWQQSKRSKAWAFVPETEAQANYVREWKPGLANGRFEVSPIASADSRGKTLSAARDLRHEPLGVVDVQAHAASHATGAGQARAATQSLAAINGRASSKNSGANPVAGAGLAAAAAQARAAIERGEVPSQSTGVRGTGLSAAASKARAAADLDKASQKARARDISSVARGNGVSSTQALGHSHRHESNRAEGASRVHGSNRSGKASHVPESPGTDSGSLLDDFLEATQELAPDHTSAVSATAEPAAPVTPTPASRAMAKPVSRSASQSASVPSASAAPEQGGDAADPLLDPATLGAARALRERFVGALLGLAVGDAVAAATQFRRAGSFSAVGDMLGGGPFDLPRGAWSDDTAMALCLAESLLERDGFDARDQVQKYARWQQEGYLSCTGQCVGITANTARSLALAKWRRVVFPGSFDPEQLDPEPLSRVASIALYYFASLETTLQQAAESSRTTCQAPAVLDACRELARALSAALSGQMKARILSGVPTITEAAAYTNNTAVSALAAAFWAFRSTDNFRDAVLRAANLGGSSDVVASVCGQLAGAHYGVSAIPPSWRNSLMQKDLIEAYADRLLAHGLVNLSS